MRVLLVAALVLAAPLAGCLAEPEDPLEESPYGTSPSDGPTRTNMPGTGTTDGGDANGSESPALGPDWSFVDTDGVTRSRDSGLGNASVIFFMATWCGSCRSAASWLDDVHAEYAPSGVQFLSVGQDPTESASDLERWKADYGQPWPHGVDADRNVQNAFGIRSQSSFVVLDADGNVVEKWGYGQASANDIRTALDAA